MSTALSHMTFIVKDLDKMAALIIEVLGGKEVYSSGDNTFSLSKEKFFLVNDLWIAVMEGEPLPERSYNHVAFKIQAHEMERYKSAIQKLGLEMREARPRIDGEGHSIYFYDYDNHLFELHTATLDERLNAYGKRGLTRSP